MRIFRPLILLLLPALALLGSCCPEDPFIPTRDTPVKREGAAFLRVIHAAVDGPSVRVLVGNEPLFQNPQTFLSFQSGNNLAKYYPVDTSAKSVIFQSGDAGSTVSEPVSLIAGQHYTIYYYGEAPDFDALLTTDSVTSLPDNSTSRFRLVNLATDAPSMNVRMGPDTAHLDLVAGNLAYGTASSYFDRPSQITYGKGIGLYTFDATTGKKIFSIPPPLVLSPGNSIITLVLAGKSKPTGNEQFVTIAAFSEGRLDLNDSLYGGLPIALSLAGVRFANLIPTSDKLLDIAFLDSSARDWVATGYFRRNLDGQEDILDVAPLGYRPEVATHPIKRYFLLALFYKTRYPYRVEISSVYDKDPAIPQEVLTQKQEFQPEVGKRYTIVAYGPFNRNDARTALLPDNTVAPTGGNIRVRLFHGGYQLAGQRLKIRVGSATTPAMGYGEIPDGRNHSVDAPAGATTIDLLDESGALLKTQEMPTNVIQSGGVYTVFLSHGAYGTDSLLVPVSEELVTR